MLQSLSYNSDKTTCHSNLGGKINIIYFCTLADLFCAPILL